MTLYLSCKRVQPGVVHPEQDEIQFLAQGRCDRLTGCCRGSNLWTWRWRDIPLQPPRYRPSNLNPTIAKPGKLLFLEPATVMSWQQCDWQIGSGGGMQACRAPRGLSWLFFLSAAWPFVALKPRIKGHRKLPVLILDRHVDGLGRPHQHLYHQRHGGCDRAGHTGIWKHVWLGHGEGCQGGSACRHVVRWLIELELSVQ